MILPVKRLVLFCAALLVLAGCETAEIASVTDPAFAGRARMAMTVVVEGPQTDLIVRQAAEQAAVKRFNESGVRALSALGLSPISDDSETGTLRGLYQRAGANIVLRMTEYSVDSHQAQTPVHYTPGYSYAHVVTDKNGNQHVVRHYVPGRYSGGHRYTRTIGRYQARLVELQSGRVMWRGDVNLVGGTSYGDLAGRAAKVLVGRLLEDGFFIVTPKQ